MPARARTAVVALATIALTVVLASLVATTSAGAASAQTAPRAARAVVTVGTSTDTFERDVIDVVNATRAQHGLRPIRRVLPCLDGLSEDWGRRMLLEGLWEHRDQMAVVRTCRLAWTGETLAKGPYNPASLVQAWMDSPPHREILLTRRARLAGIDVRRTITGSVTAVLNLGDRR